MKLELQLPPTLEAALSTRARAHARSVEDEARLLLETVLEPPNYWSEQEQLAVLDDAELWRVAARQVSADESERMQRLAERRKTAGLTPTETEELRRLQGFAQRVMLLRAEAAALLKKRGHDIASLLQR